MQQRHTTEPASFCQRVIRCNACHQRITWLSEYSRAGCTIPYFTLQQWFNKRSLSMRQQANRYCHRAEATARPVSAAATVETYRHLWEPAVSASAKQSTIASQTLARCLVPINLVPLREVLLLVRLGRRPSQRSRRVCCCR